MDIGWVLVERTEPALVQHWIDRYLYSRTVAAMKVLFLSVIMVDR